MKKVYKKPMICYESFASSTNLAAGCEKTISNQTMYVCGITTSDPETVFFSTSVDGGDCNAPGTDDIQTNDGFCYHNPLDSQNLFNS